MWGAVYWSYPILPFGIVTCTFFPTIILEIAVECFHSRGQHLYKFFGTKESVCIRKRVQLPQDWFGTPTWPPFHCFGTPIWPLWRLVKTLFFALGTRHSAPKWSLEMLHKTQNFAPVNPKCWYNVKWIKITYRMFLASCSAILWRFQSLETDTPD